MSDKIDSAQAFEQIARARHSVRGFKNDAIPQQQLENIFELAQTAPSNCNTQPWHVHVVSGDKLEVLRKELPQVLTRGEFSMDFPYAGKYQGLYKERQYDAANQLYTAMAIERADRAKRDDAFARNFTFFDAPHVAFLFIDEEFGVREAADIGMYAQNLMLALTANGLASCPQTALSFNADKVRELLDIDKQQKLLFGLSFGYEDSEHPANRCRVGRAKLSETTCFHN